jgi:NAD(P)-dependent dehydrogenase (short-subunit alcohol dehydrogenase family)
VTDIDWSVRRWNGYQAYADSKLFDAALSSAISRLRPGTASNALEPGWVATKMGGAGAPDDIDLAHVTQVWLAEAADPAAQVSGQYFYHQEPASQHRAIGDPDFEGQLLTACARVTGATI